MLLRSTAIPACALVSAALLAHQALAQADVFELEEASIAEIHSAIRSGATTCAEVVQGYVDRARAYNGVCTTLVTPDGAPVPAVFGPVRAGRPLAFPTQTVAIADLVPSFASYKGDAPDFGRMEPTASDPSVMQQFGMVAGIPNAGQVNALETLNIRGERSVTCKGDFDKHPSAGPLPAGAPAACEAFRKQPDALERAAELDRLFGRNPDLTKMPLYCVAMSFKAVYDSADMRSTGGGDVNYATDFAPTDSTLVSRVRAPARSSTRKRTTPNTTAAAVIRVVRRRWSIRCSRAAARARRGVARPATRTTRLGRPAARRAAPARRSPPISWSARSASRRAGRAATPGLTTASSRSCRRKA
jgi:hypothetical protein